MSLKKFQKVGKVSSIEETLQTYNEQLLYLLVDDNAIIFCINFCL